VPQSTRDAFRAAVLRRGDVDESGTTDAGDIDYLRDHFGAAPSWLLDLNGDGALTDLDTQLLVGTIFSTVAGDANLDGVVDSVDAAMLARGFGGATGWAGGDFDGDGVATLSDLAVLQARLGHSASGSRLADSAAVPEPSSWVLALVSMTALAATRRRRCVRRFVSESIGGSR
jgi:MYXO-CTERM domain-containing protein